MTTSKKQWESTGPIPTLPINNPYYNRFKTAYGPKLKVAITFPAEGRTKQSFKDECDINKIMAKFQTTGLIEFVNQNQGRYLDCTGVDYQEAMLTVANANSMFQSLPSGIRAYFENDPALFVDFASNPENLPQMHEMGLTSPDYKPGGHPTTPAAATQPTPLPATPSTIGAASEVKPATA